MVVFYHQLENHHHLMEALLVLWSGWGASEEGQARGGRPGDELSGKEPGHRRSCPLSMQPWLPPLLRNLL